MQKQVSTQHKKELARYYTQMGGVNETSVNAYMALNNQDYSDRRSKRRRQKKKRAVSQVGDTLKGVESAQNLLTMDDELDKPKEEKKNVTEKQSDRTIPDGDNIYDTVTPA